MAETFGLGESDRFTMLSGIAHDPIQRDGMRLADIRFATYVVTGLCAGCVVDAQSANSEGTTAL